MAGNLFSRFVPGKDDRAYYDQIPDDHDIDIENRAGLALDEENLNHDFRDDDLQSARGFGLEDSRISSGSAIPPARDARGTPSRLHKHDAGTRWLSVDDDGDNEVPASLLVEPHSSAPVTNSNPRRTGAETSRQAATPGPSSRRSRAQWETAQVQQPLHPDDGYGRPPNGLQPNGIPARRGGLHINPRDKAMYRWANVQNLDIFIGEVYNYYLGAGMWCILLDRVLHLL